MSFSVLIFTVCIKSMLLYEKITSEEERLKSLSGLVETYKTIAITTSRRIRASVLENRAFHLGLNHWFQGIKRAYAQEISKKGGENKMSFLKRNNKMIFLLLSANTGLYGDILERIFDQFSKEFLKTNPRPDIAISGKMGIRFFEENFPGLHFSYIDLPDQAVPHERLREITEFLHHYERVVVFHGRFKNIIMQEPTTSNITGDMLLSDTPVPTVRFLFEPSIEEVARFFETEIFASLFEQSCNESRLAKVTSRMLFLDRADQNIGIESHNLFLMKNYMHHQNENKKQANTMLAVVNSRS